jgi:hypothetical protein
MVFCFKVLPGRTVELQIQRVDFQLPMGCERSSCDRQ